MSIVRPWLIGAILVCNLMVWMLQMISQRCRRNWGTAIAERAGFRQAYHTKGDGTVHSADWWNGADGRLLLTISALRPGCSRTARTWLRGPVRQVEAFQAKIMGRHGGGHGGDNNKKSNHLRTLLAFTHHQYAALQQEAATNFVAVQHCKRKLIALPDWRK